MMAQERRPRLGSLSAGVSQRPPVRICSWPQSMGGPAVITLIVLGVIALVLIATAVGIFNKLVTFRNRYKNAFAQIEVQLKRRHDLIPNLVETAKGYMASTSARRSMP